MMQSSHKKHCLSLDIISLILTLGLVSYGLWNPYMSFCAFLILCAYVILQDTAKACYALFLVLPLACVFKISPTSSSFFTLCSLLFCVAKGFNLRYIRKDFAIPYFIFFLHTLIFVDSTFFSFVKIIIIPVLIYIIINAPHIKFSRCCQFFSLGLLWSSIFAFFFSRYIPNWNLYIQQDLIWELDDAVCRFSATYNDPNYYSAAVAVAIVSLAILIKNNTVHKLYSIVIFFLIYFALMTASKSFLLMLICILLLFLYLCLTSTSMYVKFSSIMLAFAVIFIGVEMQFSFLGHALDRMQGGAINTTGRTVSWTTYVTYLLDNPFYCLFGCGIGAPLLNRLAPHNTYIDVFYYWGIVGLFVFFLTINRAAYLGRRKLLCLKRTPAFIYYIMLFFLSGVHSFDFPFLCAFVGLCMQKEHVFGAATHNNSSLLS